MLICYTLEFPSRAGDQASIFTVFTANSMRKRMAKDVPIWDANVAWESNLCAYGSVSKPENTGAPIVLFVFCRLVRGYERLHQGSPCLAVDPQITLTMFQCHPQCGVYETALFCVLKNRLIFRIENHLRQSISGDHVTSNPGQSQLAQIK